MKKNVIVASLLLSLGLSGAIVAGANSSILKAKAEGEGTTETTETETETDTTDETLTEEQFTEKIKSWLSQYLDGQMVANIITWASQGGLIVALFTVYLKYRSYKAKSIDDLVVLVKEEVGKYLTKCFDGLSDVQIKKMISAIDTLEKSNETLMKALVLMQDTTTKGRATLIDFLGSKTNSAEVKETVAEVSAKVEEQQTTIDNVKEAVKDDYIPVE